MQKICAKICAKKCKKFAIFEEQSERECAINEGQCSCDKQLVNLKYCKFVLKAAILGIIVADLVTTCPTADFESDNKSLSNGGRDLENRNRCCQQNWLGEDQRVKTRLKPQIFVNRK